MYRTCVPTMAASDGTGNVIWPPRAGTASQVEDSLSFKAIRPHSKIQGFSMLQTRIKKILLSAVVTLAAALGAAGPSQAAQYSGTWDPAYGSPFNNLGWRGHAEFEFPDECLALSGTFANGTCGATPMLVLGATVEFYNLANPGTTLGTLIWHGDMPQGPLPSVNAMTFANGTITGLDTGLSDWLQGPTSLDGVDNYWFAFDFNDGQARLKYGVCETVGGYFGDYRECLAMGVNDYVGNPANVSFAPIPEPETYALMLAGLGAVSFVARRRRRR